MHSHVNYYIVNLAVCDFLVSSFVLPMKLYELMADAETSMMTNFWCTTLRFLESVIVFASVFTLVAICIERYYAIVHPVQSRVNMTNGRIHRVIFLVWIIPILCASPSLYPACSELHRLTSEYGSLSIKICHDEFLPDVRRGYCLFLFVFIYVIPLTLITFTCVSITRTLIRRMPLDPDSDSKAVNLERGRRKVAKMILVVVLTFLLCWSPYFIITAITQIYNFFEKSQFIFTMLIINLFAFTNSCINPIVYFSMSTRFRKGLAAIIVPVFTCGRHHHSPQDGSSSTLHRSSPYHTTANRQESLNHILIYEHNRSRHQRTNHINIYGNRLCVNNHKNVADEELPKSLNETQASNEEHEKEVLQSDWLVRSTMTKYGELSGDIQYSSRLNDSSQKNGSTSNKSMCKDRITEVVSTKCSEN